MAYRVRLVNKEYKNLPYELGGICADNEDEAIQKAKLQIVKQGYWLPGEDNLQDRFKKLKVESVVLDDI